MKNKHTMTLSARNDYKRHVIFSHGDSRMFPLTYCNIRYDFGCEASRKQKRCKNCTKELRKAGMSWQWYESKETRDL